MTAHPAGDSHALLADVCETMTFSGHFDLRSADGIGCKLVLTSHEWWCMLYATLQTEYAIRSVLDACLWTSLNTKHNAGKYVSDGRPCQTLLVHHTSSILSLSCTVCGVHTMTDQANACCDCMMCSANDCLQNCELLPSAAQPPLEHHLLHQASVASLP